MRMLLIEDEQEIIDFLKPRLESEGFAVDTAMDGELGVFQAATNDYDLLIVDNMLPKKTGLTVCTEVRHLGRTVPILILSVVADASKKAGLLNAGADDYLTKPFSFEELMARIRALLRRPKNLNESTLRIDDLVLDAASHVVTRGDKRIHLTPKEFGLIEFLLKNRGIVVSRGMILEHVWDMNADLFSNTIEAHILSLRKKIDLPKKRKLIHTIHGFGYKIDLEK
jgi:DNA-binding response OmpR family regulator